jgi:hypothetical protein
MLELDLAPDEAVLYLVRGARVSVWSGHCCESLDCRSSVADLWIPLQRGISEKLLPMP